MKSCMDRTGYGADIISAHARNKKQEEKVWNQQKQLKTRKNVT